MSTKFSVQELEIDGVKLITPFYVEDNRGYFLKCFEKDIFKEWGLDIDIYEEFESYSKKGVIRGLHFQTKNPQVKIVRVVKGTVHDVIVDLRTNSPTFGKYIDVMLSDENHQSLWVPRGFAHGFEVLSDEAIMSYKCIGKYSKGTDTGICWNDKDLKINWKTENPIVSNKDATLMTLQDFINGYIGLEG